MCMYVWLASENSLISRAPKEKRRSCWRIILNSQNDSWRYVRLAHTHGWSEGQGTAAVGSFLPAGWTAFTHERRGGFFCPTFM